MTDVLTHPLFHIINCTKDMYHVYLISGILLTEGLEDRLMKSIKEFKDNGFGNRSKPLKLNRVQLVKILDETSKIMEEYNLNNESEGEEESEDDDEETIQKVISRRMKRESTKEMIDSDSIDHSDDENNITITRRLRYILKELEQLKKEKK
jgi:hypothetical protein